MRMGVHEPRQQNCVVEMTLGPPWCDLDDHAVLPGDVRVPERRAVEC